LVPYLAGSKNQFPIISLAQEKFRGGQFVLQLLLQKQAHLLLFPFPD
jgi:hypothetical protein